jgi:outer membrane protease
MYGGKITKKQISITSIDSVSHEFVYSPQNNDEKLSELIWKANGVQLLGINLQYHLRRDNYINLDYKIKIGSSSNTLDDYDWLRDCTQWSHWSHHENTILDQFDIFDLSLSKYFAKPNNLTIKIDAGYNIINKKFKAYDGTYIYSSNDGCRDLTGEFEGLSITYSEKFKSLYIGGSILKQFKKFALSVGAKYSPSVQVTNQDTHHKRYFTNYNNFDNTTMLSLDMKLKYNITRTTQIALNIFGTTYKKVFGTTTRVYYEGATEYDAGDTFRYYGSAISNHYSGVNLMYIFRF